ncbi:MAG: hypothetical protein IKF71_00145 [Bacilli bacterium]|nr:hypothetical protein [Bacilli bacterium]
MKKHNIVKVVLITLLVFLVLSWIFPAAYFSSEYIDQGRVQMGLSDVFNYFMTSLSYFGHFALYLILVGCFYGVLYKIPAYRTFLDKIVAKVNSKVFIVVTVILLAFGVSFAGLQFGFAIFVPFIVALILLMGYDKIVAAMVVVGSIAAGLIGNTCAYANNSILVGTLSIDKNFQIGVRIVVLIVAIAIVLFNIYMYVKRLAGPAKKVAKPAKKEEKKKEVVVTTTKTVKVTKTSTSSKASKSSPKKGRSTKSSKGKGGRKNVNKAALREEDIIVVKEAVVSDSEYDESLVPTRVEVTHKVWPFMVGFCLLFILLVLAWITWGDSGFGTSVFDDVTNSVADFKIFGFPIFQKIYGSMNAFGSWTIIDLFFPIILLLTLLVTIYKVKFDDVLDGMLTGAKKAIVPAFIVLLLYTMLVVVTYHPYQLAIYKFVLGLFKGKGINIGTTIVTTVLASLFNVDPSYAFQALLPYYASVITNTKDYPLVAVVAQTMYGFTALFAPTSIALMCSLVYLKVSYKEWLKNAWKILLELFVVLLIIFIILALV